MPANETLTEEGFQAACEYDAIPRDQLVWATTSGFNACRECIRIHALQPVCAWSGAIVQLSDGAGR